MANKQITKQQYTISVKEIGKPVSRPKGNTSEILNMAARAAAFHDMTAYIVPTYFGPRIEWSEKCIPPLTPYTIVSAKVESGIYQIDTETVKYNFG